MTNIKEAAGRVEWSIMVGNGSPENLVPESRQASSAWISSKDLIVDLILKVWGFFGKAWDLGVDDPRKVIHCLKVGIALTVVSLFYYMRPLYEGVGGNAMWAVMTVVVVFEYTVGATICKCLNRACGTCLAGFLAIGVHWIASQSGEHFEPIIMGAAVFLLASAATFSRFIPAVKARFDYGAMIFILTFSLVSVSGYRVEKLLDMTRQRLSTIIIGTSLCILISMLIFPIWAGKELHLLITQNMDKLATSLDCCAMAYFSDSGNITNSREELNKKLLGYKCVLNSKATEETMAAFARWEPVHGPFSFNHPWKHYLKIGASMRSCAYCIEALNSCIILENQIPEFIKKHLNDTCLRVSSSSSSVLRELAENIKTMNKSSKIDLSVEEINNAVLELQNVLETLVGLLILLPQSDAKTAENQKSQPILTTTITPLVELIPLVTFASLLIEISERIRGTVDAVEELANCADFKPAADDKPKQKTNNNIAPNQQKEDETLKVLQSV